MSEFKVRFYTSAITNSPVLEIDAHAKTVFGIKSGVVYYTIFDPMCTGCSVAAFDLGKRKEIWRAHLKACGVGRSSMYSNKVNLNACYFRGIQILGRESGGDYIEILDPKTGKSLEHKIIKKEEENTQQPLSPRVDNTKSPP